MERIIVKELLNPKERDKRAAQYQAWLEEHGYTTRTTQIDTQILTQWQTQIDNLNAATAALAELYNQLNPKQ